MQSDHRYTDPAVEICNRDPERRLHWTTIYGRTRQLLPCDQSCLCPDIAIHCWRVIHDLCPFCYAVIYRMCFAHSSCILKSDAFDTARFPFVLHVCNPQYVDEGRANRYFSCPRHQVSRNTLFVLASGFLPRGFVFKKWIAVAESSGNARALCVRADSPVEPGSIWIAKQEGKLTFLVAHTQQHVCFYDIGVGSVEQQQKILLKAQEAMQLLMPYKRPDERSIEDLNQLACEIRQLSDLASIRSFADFNNLMDIGDYKDWLAKRMPSRCRFLAKWRDIKPELVVKRLSQLGCVICKSSENGTSLAIIGPPPVSPPETPLSPYYD